jgi:subtilase family serine protease
MRPFRSRSCPLTRSQARKPRLRLESLEDRTLLSISASSLAQTDYLINHPAGTASPLATAGPTGYMPSQIRHAYGFDQITLAGGVAGDGSGTTIAIVDAFDDPNVANDLQQFDAQFGLPNPSFTKVNQSGGSLLPAPDSGWASEIALDVEWSHAIAPGANILLVEANDNTVGNLLAAVKYAAQQPGVVAVSMSWGGGEGFNETSFDSTFLTPSGHSGVTFVAASGDSGAPPGYPAISPNVLAAGGTTLRLDSQGNYVSESGWSGSGGGISAVEPQPAYQHGVVPQSSTKRTNPDVAYDADPNTGFPVYDSFNNGSATPWSQFGGTSDAAPQWAALIAIADQGRILAGKTALDGASQTLPMLYQLPATDFHDITSGLSFGRPLYAALPGYDLVTGRGTPIANKIVADLVGSTVVTATHFSMSAPAGGTAGSPFSVTVTALDQNNHVFTGYTGTVHFSSSDSLAGLPANYTFTAADNGVHTFGIGMPLTGGVTLKKAGNDTITVSDAGIPSITGTATVSVTAAGPSQLIFGQQPTNTGFNNAITPAVTVQLFDAYGNPVSWDNADTVALALASNPGSGTLNGKTNATASGGVATFGNLSINQPGVGYTLKASLGSVSVVSASFTIIGPPDHLAFLQQPANAVVGLPLTPAVTVEVLDVNNNLVSSDNTDTVSLSLANNPTGATLSGNSVTVQGGVATFANLSVSQVGSGYTLTGTSSGGVQTLLPSASFSVVAAASVIEDFEHGLSLYHTTSALTPASTMASAAHDGGYGLDLSGISLSTGWIYRSDAAAQVQQGETLSVWVQFPILATGRAYFGFGASSGGTLSVVLAADTGQLILQDNRSFGSTNVAAVAQTYVPNHWYLLSVAWATGGSITGRLYNSNGTTLLNSVQGTDNTITSGGIAFHVTTSAKYFDTVSLTHSVSPSLAQPGGSGQLVTTPSNPSSLPNGGSIGSKPIVPQSAVEILWSAEEETSSVAPGALGAVNSAQPEWLLFDAYFTLGDAAFVEWAGTSW